MPVEIDNRHDDLMSSSLINLKKIEHKTAWHFESKNRLKIIYLTFASGV